MDKTLNTGSIYLTSKAVMPYYRWVNSLVVLASYMNKQGIDTVTLLTGSGIHVADLDDPDYFVTSEQEHRVIKNIISLSQDPKIGLLLGQQYHIGIHGKLGAAAASSNTLLDAIRIFFQYMDLTLTHHQYELKVKDNLAFFSMKELTDLKDLRAFICEREFVSVTRMARDMLGIPLQLNEVRLVYPKPSYASAYQDIFKCPVRFNADDNMMIWDSKYLFMQLPMANPLLKKAYENECRQLSLRLKVNETYTGRARHNLLFQKEGLPSFRQLAQGMNISPRTLRRRLTEEGTSYKALAAEVLEKKAIDLIQTTSYPMEQIAMELGYDAVPNFYRAFKRWTGHNPGYYRKKD